MLDGNKILFVSDVAGNYDLAIKLAQEYKINYLDKLDEKELCEKENIKFLFIRYSNLIKPTDLAFKLLYQQLSEMDSLIGSPGFSESTVEYLIRGSNT